MIKFHSHNDIVIIILYSSTATPVACICLVYMIVGHDSLQNLWPSFEFHTKVGDHESSTKVINIFMAVGGASSVPGLILAIG